MYSRARASVPARLRHTLVDVDLAPEARPPGRALALEPVAEVDAAPVVQTRLAQTLLNLIPAVHACGEKQGTWVCVGVREG